jgi:hypothetical protein
MRLLMILVLVTVLLAACPGREPIVEDPLPNDEHEEVRDTAPVPEELVDAMRSDLAAREGLDPAEVRFVTGRSVTWSDGSWGCPEPGEFYTQALVDGYQVILEADGVEYNYRADDRGNFRLCEDPDGDNGAQVDR